MKDILMNALYHLQEPLLFYPALFIFGAIVGSFMNVVIYRLPIMLEKNWYQDCVSFLIDLKNEGGDKLRTNVTGDKTITMEIVDNEYANPAPTFNLCWPPSHCPACKHAIRFWENIPLLSYTYLLGKCRYCKKQIPIRYFGIELFSGFASLIIGAVFGFTLQLPFALLFTYALITITFIDMDKRIIPDNITLPGLWLGLLLSLKHVFVTPSEAILGAASGYLIFWVVYWVFKMATRKEGMGQGDFKLLAFAGAWLGWQYLPIVIFIASFTGSIWGLTSLVMKISEKDQPIPFGPFLALGMWLTFILGDQITSTYLRWAY